MSRLQTDSCNASTVCLCETHLCDCLSQKGECHSLGHGEVCALRCQVKEDVSPCDTLLMLAVSSLVMSLVSSVLTSVNFSGLGSEIVCPLALPGARSAPVPAPPDACPAQSNTCQQPRGEKVSRCSFSIKPYPRNASDQPIEVGREAM